MKKKKKVLIIEGGGAFGVIPAYFMAVAGNRYPDWLTKVDCLSGCSIGGILALAYAAGNRAPGLYEFFRQRMEDCFQKRFMAKISPLANPTYDTDDLKDVLGEVFSSDEKISDIRKVFADLDIFIPALNLTDNAYKVWDNITGRDDDCFLLDVALSTSAAPSYYAGHEIGGKCFVDGGLIEVAPLMTTVTGLAGKRGVKFSDMDVLMLGCGAQQDMSGLTPKEYDGLTMLGIATDVLKPYATLSNSMSTLYWGRNMGFHSFRYWNPVPITGDLSDAEHARQCLDEFIAANSGCVAAFLAEWEAWQAGE